jgi:hypothetical protein
VRADQPRSPIMGMSAYMYAQTMQPAKANEAERRIGLVLEDTEDAIPQRRGSLDGWERLIVATLELAVLDFTSRHAVNRSDRESARAWIFDGEVGVEPFTFATVCDLLGADPDAMREVVVSMRAQPVEMRRPL